MHMFCSNAIFSAFRRDSYSMLVCTYFCTKKEKYALKTANVRLRYLDNIFWTVLDNIFIRAEI